MTTPEPPAGEPRTNARTLPRPIPPAGSRPARRAAAGAEGDTTAAPGPMPESAAWNATAHTLSPLVLFGGLGWLADRLFGVTALLPLGLFVGVAAGLAMVWVRYGTNPHAPPADDAPGGPSGDSRRTTDDRRTPEEDE